MLSSFGKQFQYFSQIQIELFEQNSRPGELLGIPQSQNITWVEEEQQKLYLCITTTLKIKNCAICVNVVKCFEL